MQWNEHGTAWYNMAARLTRFLPESSLAVTELRFILSYSKQWSGLLSKRCINRSANLQQSRSYRPRRAVMYVPASDERKYRKIPSLGADTVVLDCEDGVANNKKEEARINLPSALNVADGVNCECVVRVNGVDSAELMTADLECVFGSSMIREPDALMLPKCENIEHLQQLDFAVGFHRGKKPHPLPLFVIVESPSALLRLQEICSVGVWSLTNIRLEAAIFGSDDFLASLGGHRTATADELMYARQHFVTTVKSHELQAIDLVSIDYKNLTALKAQSEEGARMGFTGKQIIHPGQVPVVQEAFSPSVKQMNWAVGLIKAFENHQLSGKGAFVYEDKMIDRPLLLQAQNIVKLKQSLLAQ